MILVDTSVWIEHFRQKSLILSSLLHEDRVTTHPFVIGEIACGRLKQRKEILSLLTLLPTAKVASDAEVLFLLEKYEIFGQGIGWIDAHLLAAALLSKSSLWTHDKSLRKLALVLEIPLQ